MIAAAEAVNHHMHTEAFELADLLWYINVEGELAGERYATALRDPYAEPGMNLLYRQCCRPPKPRTEQVPARTPRSFHGNIRDV